MTSHFHIVGICSKTGAFAFVTFCLAPVAREQNTILYFVIFGFYFFKKLINPHKVGVPFPKGVDVFFTELVVGFVYWKIEFIGIFYKLFVKFSHACSTPGSNGIIENRTAGIWNHQLSVNSDDITKSLTFPARSKRIIKAKEVNIWRNKSDTVQFKSIGKGHLLFLIQ